VALTRFPEGRRFAFSILDDTDVSTLENVKPVYDLLRELGFRTTKTVWPLDCPEGSERYHASDTLQRPEYLAFVRELAAAGFEIAFHGATMESSRRERTERALAFLERELGRCPRLHANHGENRENLYWGPERFRTPLLRWVVARLGRQPRGHYVGEREESEYFWGDLCARRFDYVRNFTFAELDLLAVNPEAPYRLASTPHVTHWFSTTAAPDVEDFRRLFTRAALDRLEAAGGVCIVTTHLGKGFARNGRIDPGVADALADLARRPGWFAPVSEILDHLRQGRAERPLGRVALLRLELRYLFDQLRARASMASR
jgi:hypothetical protein